MAAIARPDYQPRSQCLNPHSACLRPPSHPCITIFLPIFSPFLGHTQWTGNANDFCWNTNQWTTVRGGKRFSHNVRFTIEDKGKIKFKCCRQIPREIKTLNWGQFTWMCIEVSPLYTWLPYHQMRPAFHPNCAFFDALFGCGEVLFLPVIFMDCSCPPGCHPVTSRAPAPEGALAGDLVRNHRVSLCKAERGAAAHLPKMPNPTFLIQSLKFWINLCGFDFARCVFKIKFFCWIPISSWSNWRLW